MKNSQTVFDERQKLYDKLLANREISIVLPELAKAMLASCVDGLEDAGVLTDFDAALLQHILVDGLAEV